MVRLIKRYGSRKLYDTEESRYVLLEDVGGWIRGGQEIRVIDNRTGEDVTSQTLTQIISEEGRSGRRLLPNVLLHEIIRAGQGVVSDGMGRLQDKVDRLVQRSVDRLTPVRKAREEMILLRQRLQELESSLAALESDRYAVASREERGEEAAKGGRTEGRVRPARLATAKKSGTTRKAGRARKAPAVRATGSAPARGRTGEVAVKRSTKTSTK